MSAMMGAAMMTERPMFFDRRARFAREDGDVFKAAQRAERHLAEDVKAENRGRGQRQFDRMIFRQLARGARNERQCDERAVSDQEQDGAGIVHPFAKAEPADGDEDQPGNQRAVERRDENATRRQPGRGGTDGVGKIGRDDEPGAGHDGDAEQPEIPRHDEAGEFVEAKFRPLVEAAFQRHEAIEINHHRRHREVEKENGEQPIAVCAEPSFAAVPTHEPPTTKTICVRTRSRSPSSFLKTALCAATRSSSRRKEAVPNELATMTSPPHAQRSGRWRLTRQPRPDDDAVVFSRRGDVVEIDEGIRREGVAQEIEHALSRGQFGVVA